MLDITMGIGSLVSEANVLRKNPDVDKRVLNKVGALLWEAELLSRHLVKQAALADRASLDSTASSTGCICLPGITDSHCPVHGGGV